MKFQLMDKTYDFLNLDWNDETGLTIQIQNPILNMSITIQSTKLDCNPDLTIQQSNPVIPWLYEYESETGIVKNNHFYFHFTMFETCWLFKCSNLFFFSKWQKINFAFLNPNRKMFSLALLLFWLSASSNFHHNHNQHSIQCWQLICLSWDNDLKLIFFSIFSWIQSLIRFYDNNII